MSESFTYGSVGGVGYNLGGNSRGRPAPTRKGTPTSYLPAVVGVGLVTSPDVNSWLNGPVSGMFCGLRTEEPS